ncbi:YPDG domain-containing protein [Dermabacter hominis]
MAPSFTASGLDRAMAAQPAQTAPSFAPMANEPAQDQIIDADMIASGRVKKAANLTDAHGVGKGLISGHVYLTTPGGNPGASYDNGNVKMDGITVYAQFRDKDGSYSPIFSAKTHTLPDVVGGNGGKGTFAFGTGNKGITWTDKFGKEHTWAARTDQKHRIWVEPFTNKRGNRVEMFRQANGFVPGSFNGLVEAPLGSFGVADANIGLMAEFLQEAAPSHENSYMVARDETGAAKIEHDSNGFIDGQNPWNSVSGRVWLETGGLDKGIVATGPSKNTADPAADGYTVYASTLTKDGAAANQKLHEQYKNDPDKLAEATKKMLEDHPEYILKTVSGTTDAEGRYTLRFNDGQTATQQSRDNLNVDHMFLWVENKDGVVQHGYTGFHTPVFQRFTAGGNFRPSAVPAPNVLTPDISRNRIYNVNYALMPYSPVSITADYNAIDKPAAPGTTVTPEFKGDLSDLPSKIEWRDKNGKVVKTCDLDQSKSVKAQVAACTFGIPADAKKGDIFNVVVVSGGNDVAAWSVLVTDKNPDADIYEPAYEDKLVVPGKETKSSPSFTGKDGSSAKAPEGSEFKITDGFTAPEGYEVKIDENTGEITVTFPDGSKLNKDTVEQFDVPVTVTYPDGSTDKTDANFKLDTDNDGKPDTEDGDDDNDGIPDKDDSNPKVPNANDHFEPGYEDGSGKPGEDVTVPAPGFKDKDGKDTTAPEGTKFTPGENAPGGVTIDKDTGEITVTIPGDAKPGDKITVPVVVTYPDGSKDNVDVTVTVEQPDAPAPKQNEEFEPGYEDGSGKPGEDVKVPAPGFKDKDGKDTKAPEGTKFTPGENAPGGVTIDKDTGEITVTIPGDAKPGDKITVPVEVTYPDGTKDNVDVTVTVEQPDAPAPKQNEEFEPGYEDGSGKPGDDVKVPAPEFKDKDGKDTKAPEGTKFTPGDNAPDGVTIDENTGEITVKVPEDAKPGDKITVPVVVTYPDGSKDTVDVTVTVEEPEAPAEKPDWNDDKGQPGDKVEIPNTGGPVEDGTTVETEGPGKAEIDEDGKITVDIDKDAKPGDKIVVVVKDKDGNEIDRVVVEVEKPADKPAEKPDWKDNSGKPGENVVIPNEGGKVPEGSTVETEGPGKAEIDEDGNLVVDINDDAKPGDKVTVVVKDKDGKVIDTVTVTVEKPEAPAEQPAPGGNDNGTAQPKPGTSNGNGPVKRVPLPRTGAEVAGVAGAAAALIAAGLGLVFSRRRREGEEN